MITEDQQPDFRHIQHVAYWSMVAHGTMTHPVYRG